MFKGGIFKPNDENVVHFYFEKPGFPSGPFKKVVSKYMNGLLNTKGGVLVFGVRPRTGEIIGCRLSREEEDHLKLEVDQEIRAMRPTVSPNLCRFTVIPLMKESSAFIITIKIGAAPIGETYMNSLEQMFVVRKRELFGPLIPQEIKELVIAKYREEISSSAGLLSPAKET
ncbi:unnamed protein product [Porites lobata]|uniref:Schlafen AlbA-2 domain-containing protein n=1 Tax=Porites lobata TaxID=104759 RepID=A0ABN8Q7I2_9CNID|nr:unnamed protein product [Porites lobata]